MSIPFSSTAPITPAPVETPTDSVWVISNATDGSSLSPSSIAATYVFRRYLANSGNPIFADASGDITVRTSSVPAMAAQIPAAQAVEALKPAAALAVLTAYTARVVTLSTAMDRLTTAQTNFDEAKTDAAAALKILQDAQTAARAAGVNGVDDPTYIAAYAAAVAAKPLADSTAVAQATAKTALDTATALVASAKAAKEDMALPPVVLT